MRDLFATNPTHAVRSKSFITLFQNYCADELRARGVESNGLRIRIEQKIAVGRGRVEADVGVFNEKDEPVLIVDVRSQMSSLGKNFNNYIRMKAGEVESLHAVYPNCIIGLVYIHPAADVPTKLPVNPVGSFNYANAAKQLSSLIVTNAKTELLSKYQHVSYCVVDFNSAPPQLSETIPAEPELRLENFFDDLFGSLSKR
ncbi:hypothetical protein HYW58_00015 [Candidatus Kaiserbacteria bacterium]|nr:hypothetical protein [Candidatus Kaiserbacteria bacterium]